MANLNKVMLMGNLTRDPEPHTTQSGMVIVKFGMAINRKIPGRDGAEPREEVCFVDCVSFGKTAEALAKYLHKGKPLFVEGRLNLEQWDDKETGAKRSKLGVVVESFQFLESKKDASSPSAPQREAAPAKNAQGTSYDEIPF